MTTVTDADREAAAEYWRLNRIGNNETQRRYLSGEADLSFIVQALARHREQAEQRGAEREREATVAWLRSNATKRSDLMKADAIARGEHLRGEG